MKHIYVIIFGLLLHFEVGSTKNRTSKSDIRVCQGSADPFESERYHPVTSYKNIRKKYSGCTHILNHLSISHLKEGDDTSFLTSIVDVRGSVYIARNNISTIPLPKLRYIRGRSCIVSDSGNMKFSLMINFNRSPNRSPAYIDLRALKVVGRCDIAMGMNIGMCNLKTIGFHRFFTRPDQGLMTVLTRHRECSVPERCSKTCPKIEDPTIRRSSRFCWGPKPNMCLNDTRYRGQCHKECRDGCFGPTSAQCVSCRHVEEKGKCVKKCPKFSISEYCLDRCPKRYLKHGRECVVNCPRGFFPRKGKCIPCRGSQCDIVCRPSEWTQALLKKKPGLLGKVIFKDGYLTHTPRSFMKEIGRRGCTILDGDIRITGSSSVDLGFGEFIRKQDLNNLKKLKHINGYVYLYLIAYPEIKDLKFLSNMETINTPKRQWGLQIYKSHLKGSLQQLLSKLKSVDAPIVSFELNKGICTNEVTDKRVVGAFKKVDMVVLPKPCRLID